MFSIVIFNGKIKPPHTQPNNYESSTPDPTPAPSTTDNVPFLPSLN
ncbi:hypothetical protein KAI60_03740 [Candidatus Bathyarchaeota archaeon]|nr:hypothetical protein [Candidatus Bathyarchaeota archaeon]